MGASSEGRGWAGQSLPRRCPARTATPRRRRHPEESASAVGPLQWRAGGACRGAGPGQGQRPRQWGRGCRGPGAGRGPTVGNEVEHQVSALLSYKKKVQKDFLCHSEFSNSVQLCPRHADDTISNRSDQPCTSKHSNIMCVCECLEQATYPAHTYLAYLMVKFCLPHHVGHVVESGVFPVGGALIGEQPVSVCVRKTSRSWLSPPTPRRAPPSGKKTQEFTVRLDTDGTIMSLALVLTGMWLVCLKYDFSRV